ncbi:hypothetical protein D477_017814 [Arthrobacter crystallopoietes BAB-32]|uniref:DUF3592 domain-containing protein n=1 Tax=Arthrobacter crystallopoietes BAB-32 TaxID=1246476 RepID=N1UV34_9MICC|nr:hypothetical protein [Arthrobacter crystallopoietes]EMY32905.1 hypothetical protein D477_017814 [Arthrobacter crystallopoietes BAB-32]
MSDALETVGLISELMTWATLVPGLLLLLAAWLVKAAGVRWRSAEAVAFDDGVRSGVRWFDRDHGFLEAVLAPGETIPAVPGSDVLVYYDAHNPTRWRTAEPPERGTTLLLLGKILTGVGVAALLAGFLVMIF